jgi:molybdopterin converting factor small subunit
MTFGFSGSLLRFTDYQREVQVEAATLGEALSTLATRLPALRPVLFDAQGTLRGVHRLFLNGQQLAHADLGQALAPTDRLDVLTAIAGG